MRLVDVFGSVKAKLDPILADAGLEKTYHRLGQQHVPEIREDAPRIVWVPRGGSVSFSRQGTRRATVAEPSSDNPIFLATRETLVDVYIWDDDIRKTEDLLAHFVAALHAGMAGQWAPIGERWVPWHPILEADAAATAWVLGTEADEKIRMLCVFSFTAYLDLVNEATGEVPPPVVATIAENLHS